MIDFSLENCKSYFLTIPNSVETDELTLYADVDADMAFLKSQGVKHVAVDGLSIGGTRACQMAKKYGAKHDERPDFPKVKALIPEHTLTSGEEVVKNAATNLFDAGALGQSAGQIVLEKGLKDAVNDNVTDGLDNMAKVEALRDTDVQVLAIRGTQDTLMGKGEPDENGNFPSDFAFDLVGQLYDDQEEIAKHVVSVNGGHCYPYTADAKALKQVIDFLNGAMPSSDVALPR